MLYNNNRSRVVYDEMAFGVENKKRSSHVTIQTSQYSFGTNTVLAHSKPLFGREGVGGQTIPTTIFFILNPITIALLRIYTCESGKNRVSLNIRFNMARCRR